MVIKLGMYCLYIDIKMHVLGHKGYTNVHVLNIYQISLHKECNIRIGIKFEVGHTSILSWLPRHSH